MKRLSFKDQLLKIDSLIIGQAHGMRTLAKTVNFDPEFMWVDLSDGRRLGVPLAYFPPLLYATPEQRGRYEISGGGAGLHWDEIDEDISVEGLLLGIGDQTKAHHALGT